MITTVLFTADSRAGNLARIALAARRLGYRAVKQSKLKSDNSAFDKIQLQIESDLPIQGSELEGIRDIVSTVVNIQTIGNAQIVEPKTPPSAAKRATQAAPKPAVSAASSADVKVLLSQFGKQIVADYPNVSPHVVQFEDRLSIADRDDGLLRLGKGIGRWQYKKNYSLGSKLSLDKTVQRMLYPALSEFADVERQGSSISLSNCPHGQFGQRSAELSCNFIVGYIQGFMNEIGHFRGVEVVQTAKSSGAGQCTFEIRPK